MKVTSQMPSSTSLRPTNWPANTVETLIFLRSMQTPPRAVTMFGDLAIEDGPGLAGAVEDGVQTDDTVWLAHGDVPPVGCF